MGTWLLFLFLIVLGLYWVFRSPRKKVYYGQTFEEKPPVGEHPPVRDVLEGGKSEDDDAPKELTPGTRIAAILFLGVWLTFWTFGCYFALVTAAELSYGEEGYIFLRIWLAMAIPAWFIVAWTLFRLLRGDHVDISFDGDAGGDGGGD